MGGLNKPKAPVGLWPESFGIVYPIGARKERDEWPQRGRPITDKPIRTRHSFLAPVFSNGISRPLSREQRPMRGAVIVEERVLARHEQAT